MEKFYENPVKYAKELSIPELVDLLKLITQQYYEGESLVSDDVFDMVKNVLEERDPTNAYLDEIGYESKKKDRVPLPYPMPSLKKVKPDTNALAKWMKQFNKGPYVVSVKLDGISCLLSKSRGELKMFTRGDGTNGTDITKLIPSILDVKGLLALPDNVALRGELIISKTDFEDLKEQYSTVRSAVIGVAGSGGADKVATSKVKFITYSILNPPMLYVDQLKTLKGWGFKVVSHTVIGKDELSNDYLTELLVRERENNKYNIDGLVIADSSEIYKVEPKNPTHSFAFKTVLNDQMAETMVVEMEWNASMYGLLKPVAIVEPVTINGEVITRVTAIHAKNVVDNVLGVGSKILLILSGDVIPKIEKVITPASNGKPGLPDVPYKWNKSGVDIMVSDVHEEADNNIKVKQIAHFFKVLGVKYISEGIITKLVENGYDSVLKILDASKDDLIDIDRIGSKLVDKIFKGIDEAFKSVTLEQLMAGSLAFGRGFGVRKTGAIVKVYPDIMTRDFTVDDIVAIDGFDTLTATQFVGGFDDFVKFYDGLVKVGYVSKDQFNTIKPSKTSQKRFEGMKVVVTGTRDEVLMKLIEDEGGKISSSVSKNTSLVIYSDTTTGKYTRAVELGIPVMTWDEFKKKYNV